MTVDSGGVRMSPPRASLTGRALILGLVAVTLGLALAVPVRAWFAQRSEIAQLRADVESARERVAALQDQKVRWEDPAFVASQARARLHYVLPGEIGFTALGLDSIGTETAAQAAARHPWYASLWKSVQGADDQPAVSAKPASLTPGS